MNKKRIIIIIGIILSVALIVALVLTQYSGKNKELFVEKNTIKGTENDETINEHKYIKIKSYVEKEQTLYQYRVYSKQGKLLYEEKNMSKYPDIKKIEKYKFSVGISAGTSTYVVRYFDVRNEQVSDIFITPLDLLNNKVIWYDGKIIVQDIFDKSKYYEEIELKVSDAAFPIVFARFLSSDTIQVRYMAGNDYEEKTKTFHLKK